MRPLAAAAGTPDDLQHAALKSCLLGAQHTSSAAALQLCPLSGRVLCTDAWHLGSYGDGVSRGAVFILTPALQSTGHGIRLYVCAWGCTDCRQFSGPSQSVAPLSAPGGGRGRGWTAAWRRA